MLLYCVISDAVPFYCHLSKGRRQGSSECKSDESGASDYSVIADIQLPQHNNLQSMINLNVFA